MTPAQSAISMYERVFDLDAATVLRTAAKLSPRLREYLNLIPYSTPTAVAEAMGISTKTGEVHRANLIDRFEVQGVAGLVRVALFERLCVATLGASGVKALLAAEAEAEASA